MEKTRQEKEKKRKKGNRNRPSPIYKYFKQRKMGASPTLSLDV